MKRKKIYLIGITIIVFCCMGYFIFTIFVKGQNYKAQDYHSEQKDVLVMDKRPVENQNNADELKKRKMANRKVTGYQLDKVISDFQESFYSGDKEELYEKANEITKLGKAALSQLLDIVTDRTQDSVLRKMAFELIREIGPRPQDVSILTEVLENKNDDSLIRSEAAWTLGLTASPEAVAPLVQILVDKSENVRIRELSATSLGLLGYHEGKAVLIETVLDKNNEPIIRSSAAKALGAFNSQEVREVLVNSLQDQSWKVKIGSAKGLSKIGDNEAAIALNSVLIKMVQNKKTDTNDAVIRTIINSLSIIRNSESIPVLIKVLRGADPYYSALAGKALGEIGDQRALIPIKQTLEASSDPFQHRLLDNAYKKLSNNP